MRECALQLTREQQRISSVTFLNHGVMRLSWKRLCYKSAVKYVEVVWWKMIRMNVRGFPFATFSSLENFSDRQTHSTGGDSLFLVIPYCRMGLASVITALSRLLYHVLFLLSSIQSAER